MNSELVLVLDFGGQYNQLIARRVRECNVYAEVIPYTTSLEDIKAKNPKGIIFTGGPNSVWREDSPSYDKSIFEIGVPILGICYGSQLMAHKLGGEVATAPVSEYGKTEDSGIQHRCFLKVYLQQQQHGRAIRIILQKHRRALRLWYYTGNCPVAAMEKCRKKAICGTVPPGSNALCRRSEDVAQISYLMYVNVPVTENGSFVETTIARFVKK